MNWKSTVIVSGPAVVATWLFSTPATAPSTTPAPVVATAVPAASTSDIEREAARLQAKLHDDGEYHAPSRNPFRFSARAARPVAIVHPVDAAPPPIAVPSAPPRPALHLDGIASDGDDAAPRRTAILGTGVDVVLAQEGESAAGYRVETITDDAVTLVGADGVSLTLTLR